MAKEAGSAADARATKKSTADSDSKSSPRERVIRDIMRKLYDGTIEPGRRLTEAKLTAEYGVSRGPVREALNRLAANGVVELAPQRGAQIRVMTLDEAIDSLVVAQSLVGTAARLAAEQADKGDEKQRLMDIVATLRTFDQGSRSVDYAIARNSFYSTLAKIADNGALSRVMMQVHMHLIRAQFRILLRTVERRRHADYTDIAKAVMDGDARRAERVARAHLGRSIDALRQHKAKETEA